MSLLVSDLRLRWRSLLWWTVGVVLSTLRRFLLQIHRGRHRVRRGLQQPAGVAARFNWWRDLGTRWATSHRRRCTPSSCQRFSSSLPSDDRHQRWRAKKRITRSTCSLAQPISRTALYVQKVVGVALGVAVLAIAVAVPVIALADWSELEVPAANLWAATAQLFAFVLFLGMLAMTVSASIGRRAAGVEWRLDWRS